MKKIMGLKTIKTGLGASIAMIIAQAIGLKFAASAGIITILSIQNTKRESLVIALRRIGATCMALTIGSIIFKLMGFYAISFGVYLMIFIPLAVKMKVTEGIVPASVLVTHLLGEKSINIGLLGNEMGLMLVGVGIALLLNSYMPSVEEAILIEKLKIEENMQTIFLKMEAALQRIEDKLEVDEAFDKLEKALERGAKKAIQYRNNTFFSDKSLYEKYFDMRYAQYQVMIYMKRHFMNFYEVAPGAESIAKLTHEIAQSTTGHYCVEEVMAHLEELREQFKESELPTSREEFENRAMLYQFLTDLEQVLFIKQMFKSGLSEKEKEEYSKYYNIEVFPGK